MKLFEVPFAAAMTDEDLAGLAGGLGLSTKTGHTGRPREGDLAFARLDHSSGLFLKAGPADGQWLLHARTWGQPASDSVHRWHVLAANAAHRLDPTVSPPERLVLGVSVIPDRRLEPTGNGRLGRFRRRLVGLH